MWFVFWAVKLIKRRVFDGSDRCMFAQKKTRHFDPIRSFIDASVSDDGWQENLLRFTSVSVCLVGF